jgi:hypothetical protein
MTQGVGPGLKPQYCKKKKKPKIELQIFFLPTYLVLKTYAMNFYSVCHLNRVLVILAIYFGLKSDLERIFFICLNFYLRNFTFIEV